MEQIIDSVRRIVAHWVVTSAKITQDLTVGQTIIPLDSSKRFLRNDEIMIKCGERYENGLNIKRIVDNKNIELVTPVKFDWLESDNPVIVKTFNNMFIQAVFFGDPETIPSTSLPCITVAGTSRTSEWLTLNSTTEKYNIQIIVYVEDNADEAATRFLMQVANTIQKGFKRNVFPLINDYNTIGLTESAAAGDVVIKVATVDGVLVGSRIFVEDPFKTEDVYARSVDAVNSTIELTRPLCYPYDIADTPIVILPSRLIYNSWPSEIDYMKVHKNTLMKAAVINWFAEEEEIQNMQKFDPHLK